MRKIGFDLENVYDQEIAPLMEKIFTICKRVDMPMVSSFAYATDSFCTTAIIDSERTPARFVATYLMVSRRQEN